MPPGKPLIGFTVHLLFTLQPALYDASEMWVEHLEMIPIFIIDDNFIFPLNKIEGFYHFFTVKGKHGCLFFGFVKLLGINKRDILCDHKINIYRTWFGIKNDTDLFCATGRQVHHPCRLFGCIFRKKR